MIHLIGATAYVPYPSWLNPADNTWQITAATFVGLMSLPGLAVLYASIVPKKWAVNVLAMMFAGFSLVLISWFLWTYKLGFSPTSIGGGVNVVHGVVTQTQNAGTTGTWQHFFENFIGKPGTTTNSYQEQGQALSAANTIIPVPLPDRQPRLFPVRVRGDHATAVPRQRARPDQVLGLVHPRPTVVDLRLRRRRLHALGRWLLRPGGRARLLGWVRHPHVGRSLRLRGGVGARTETPSRSTARLAQQPCDGGGRCRHPVARLERVQRW